MQLVKHNTVQLHNLYIEDHNIWKVMTSFFVFLLFLDLDKPTVTVTPSSVVDEATAVNLSCSATASGNITYSWKKDGQSYNSSSRIFSIANGSNIDSGSYVCIVSTELGTKYSTALQVYFRCKY